MKMTSDRIKQGQTKIYRDFELKVKHSFEGIPGGSLYPCSWQNFPCVPLFPKSIFFLDFGVPCSLNTAFVPVLVEGWGGGGRG